VWWRSISLTIEEGLNQEIHWLPPWRSESDGAITFESIVERFGEMDDGMVVGSQRDVEFQNLIYDLLQLSYFRVTSAESGNTLELTDSTGFRWHVEPLWPENAISSDLAGAITDSYTLPELGQILVSMMPLTPEAIQIVAEHAKEHNILLLDHNDIARVVDGEERIEQLLEQRIETLRQDRDPYPKVPQI
jgi:hypothetical protein